MTITFILSPYILRSVLEIQVDIPEKRYASALAASLRAAVPLHSSNRESYTTTQSGSDTSTASKPRTAAPARDRHLPKHLESDSVAAVRLPAAPERASLNQAQQLEHYCQHSRASLHG